MLKFDYFSSTKYSPDAHNVQSVVSVQVINDRGNSRRIQMYSHGPCCSADKQYFLEKHVCKILDIRIDAHIHVHVIDNCAETHQILIKKKRFKCEPHYLLFFILFHIYLHDIYTFQNIWGPRVLV